MVLHEEVPSVSKPQDPTDAEGMYNQAFQEEISLSQSINSDAAQSLDSPSDVSHSSIVYVI